jgi:hypothetical protein
MEQLVGRFGMLVGVLAAFSLATLTAGAGLRGADAQGSAAALSSTSPSSPPRLRCRLARP